jgi:hypothetical protein
MFQAQLELYLIIHSQLHNFTDTCGTTVCQKSVLKHAESDNAVLGPGIIQKMDVICGISITMFDY